MSLTAEELWAEAWPEVNWHEASPEDHKMYLDHAASIAEYRKGN